MSTKISQVQSDAGAFSSSSNVSAPIHGQDPDVDHRSPTPTFNSRFLIFANGSTQDLADRLKSSLMRRNFFVKIYKNCKKDEIKKVVQELRDESMECLGVALLTESTPNGMLFDDAEHEFDLDEIAGDVTGDKFKVMATKPKIFILDAPIRKGSESSGLSPKISQGNVGESPSSEKKVKLPVHANFLFAYSSVPNWLFADTLWRALVDDRLRELDLVQLFRVVRAAAQQRYKECYPDATDGHTQIPGVSSTLTRLPRPEFLSQDEVDAMEKTHQDGDQEVAGEGTTWTDDEKKRIMESVRKCNSWDDFKAAFPGKRKRD